MTSQKNLATAAGPTDAQPFDQALVDTINQVFALFRINYHNQFYAAFADTQLLNQAKRLWLESLKLFSPEQILDGAKIVIENSDYLPTLHKMLSACLSCGANFGLPDVRDAYAQASNAPSPKAAQQWSHPAVYHAGKKTGWHNLASQPEGVSWPIFQRHYLALCRDVVAGAELTIDAPPALEQHPEKPLTREERQRRLQALREDLDL